MKNGKKLPSFIAGMVTMALICMLCVPALAANNTQTLQNVRVGGINIVVDGQTIHPTDANGKEVSPLIYNGTTYLPVRAVASALGKAVYWDGPTYTVYLGEMSGTLEYPTAMLEDLTSISGEIHKVTNLKDNYGNSYATAIENDAYGYSGDTYEYLLNMKYSRFKGTICIPSGESSDEELAIIIKADSKIVFSQSVNKTSHPIPVDINITGCNDFTIYMEPSGYQGLKFCLADAGFYQ